MRMLCAQHCPAQAISDGQSRQLRAKFSPSIVEAIVSTLWTVFKVKKKTLLSCRVLEEGKTITDIEVSANAMFGVPDEGNLKVHDDVFFELATTEIAVPHVDA
ncbi:hypothetical protein PCASD_22785 [Puccinia coronata f. sp. avenae]|uniref:Uncharacterized protein n=1 Tax=Puccinia coronata f. sp. avenae TaxID=200324 RepID=A0A2N5TJ60_9BASI|nr:hypothetical protein PCASD_22785 [Puccinia coronata f. sp. avenae]